ncbi:MAG: DNA cytosine methyltransferase [Bacteroidales bacterium]|nr:DNA cytosine methyltransferase [Bacteroidales bacterium]
MSESTSYTFVDLFAGCGGLSEGFYRQGFKALAHVEIDHAACETLRERLRYYNYPSPENDVIEEDIKSPDILAKMDKAIDKREVDVIIGGPPCQAYSTAGRVRDRVGMEKDARNFLFESYVSILEHYLPKVFVFENVTGLLTARVGGNRIFPQIIEALSKKYCVVDDTEIILFNTANYGVPQIRKRLIIMGIRKDLKGVDIRDLYRRITKTHFDPSMAPEDQKGLKKFVDVKEAIGDLPPVAPGEDASTDSFNYVCNNDFLKAIGKKGVHPLRDHICRKHNEKDRERFREMIAHEWSFRDLRNNRPDLEHEHARVFDNSYVVQWWNLPSKTILAHIHKDGFQFIHPDFKQARSFTVREAARIQSFPDDFVFKGSRGDKFKQIGNAVPCLFAEALAKAIKTTLEDLI